MGLNINGAGSYLGVAERFGGRATFPSSTVVAGSSIKAEISSSPSAFTNVNNISIPQNYYGTSTNPNPWIEPRQSKNYIAAFTKTTSPATFNGVGLSGHGSISRANADIAALTLKGTGKITLANLSGGWSASLRGGCSINATLVSKALGFTSIDNMIYNITSGNTGTVFWEKTLQNANIQAGSNYDWFVGGDGDPPIFNPNNYVNYYQGKATVLNSSTPGAMPLNSNVAPAIRSLLNITAGAGVSFGGNVQYLSDYLLIYPDCAMYSVTGTPLNNTATLPRYTNGVGVKCIVAVSYLRTGTATAPFNSTLTINWTASDKTSQTSVMNTPVDVQNPGGLAYDFQANLFMPLNGKTGVKAITSYSCPIGSNALVSFILLKPLTTVKTVNNSLPSIRECVYQIQALPQIMDDACLGIMGKIGGGTTTVGSQIFTGRFQYAWSS